MGVITFAAAGNSFATFNAQGLGDPARPKCSCNKAWIVQMKVPRPILNEVRHLLRYLLQALSLPMLRQEQVATQTLSGTSMASPYVAGVSSLMRQLNPNLSVDDFEKFFNAVGINYLDPATGGTYRVGCQRTCKPCLRFLLQLQQRLRQHPPKARMTIQTNW